MSEPELEKKSEKKTRDFFFGAEISEGVENFGRFWRIFNVNL